MRTPLFEEVSQGNFLFKIARTFLILQVRIWKDQEQALAKREAQNKDKQKGKDKSEVKFNEKEKAYFNQLFRKPCLFIQVKDFYQDAIDMKKGLTGPIDEISFNENFSDNHKYRPLNNLYARLKQVEVMEELYEYFGERVLHCLHMNVSVE